MEPERAVREPAISIHALCEEGDELFLPVVNLQTHFYPRPLRGGRQNSPFP